MTQLSRPRGRARPGPRACLLSKAPGPKPGVILAEENFSTAQEDANVVGNIYFANYAVWQGRVADRYFHSVAPHYYEDRGARGELHRPETSTSQLRDAMPFYEINVVMRLDELMNAATPELRLPAPGARRVHQACGRPEPGVLGNGRARRRARGSSTGRKSSERRCYAAWASDGSSSKSTPSAGVELRARRRTETLVASGPPVS